MASIVRSASPWLIALSMTAIAFPAMADETAATATMQQMQSAIASFGVTQAESTRAAAAAIEEIAQKKRANGAAGATNISQIPDDLLEISPYDL